MHQNRGKKTNFRLRMRNQYFQDGGHPPPSDTDRAATRTPREILVHEDMTSVRACDENFVVAKGVARDHTPLPVYTILYYI